MATVLKLVRGAIEVELNKTGDAVGFHLRHEQWYPAVADYVEGREPEPVTETMQLVVRPSSDDNYATLMQSLHDMARYARQYTVDSTQTTPVWLHAKLDAETNERRALVHSISIQYGTSWLSKAQAQKQNFVTVVITRGPYWEALTATALTETDDTELLSNYGFETAGAGGADVFADWTESASDGAISRTNTTSVFGTWSAMLTAGASVDTHIYQDATVTAGQRYTLYFGARGDGTYSGRFQIYDQTNSADILALTDTLQTSTSWGLGYHSFVAPAGCTTVRIYLYCPDTDTGVCYWDNVHLTEFLWGPAVVWDYSFDADIVGDVGGRLAPLTISQRRSTLTGLLPEAKALNRIWCGVRSANKHGTLANFVPVWECEDSDTSLGTDSARAYDAEASPCFASNTVVTVTPGTATWARRLIIELGDITTNYEDNWGRYLWLLRAKVGSSTTWEVKVRWSYSLTTTLTYVEGPTVEISSTDYSLYEMGIGDIPLYSPKALPDDIMNADLSQSWSLEVWARRTSGSGILTMDCFCPIPVDEGFALIDNASFVLSSGSGLVLGTGPDGTTQGLTLLADASSVRTFPEVSAQHFYLPPGAGRMIIAARESTHSDLATGFQILSLDTDKVDNPAYFPRWFSLRGSE